MTYTWYQWMAFAALGICLVACALILARLVRMGKPKDFSRPAGNTVNGIRWAFTGAMSPTRKESAFLHLPTYTAGLFYHIGTFLSFFLFFFIFTGLYPHGLISAVITSFLVLSSMSGMAVLVKRIVSRELKSLSNPDDYLSNFLVTLFQFSTIAILLSGGLIVQLVYYFSFSVLALYIPVGKLKHVVYFFAARYHLGYFFGWRGVWPQHQDKR
jgi:hypothetical protein